MVILLYSFYFGFMLKIRANIANIQDTLPFCAQFYSILVQRMHKYLSFKYKVLSIKCYILANVHSITEMLR